MPQAWVFAIFLLCLEVLASPAQAQVRAGTLTCTSNARARVVTNVGQRMLCQYVTSWGRLRSYTGVVARFDGTEVLGDSRFMRWSVHSNARQLRRGELIGRYVAAGDGPFGATSDDLVKGGPRPVVLRPSTSSRAGARSNIAPGVKDMSISPGRNRAMQSL